jgi:hypothetical protein
MEREIRLLVLFVAISFCVFNSNAQTDAAPYFKGALKQNRINARHNIINNIIYKNLSLPLTDSTEENWQDAFWAMEVMQYKLPWVNNCIQHAFDSIEKRSVDFQRALMELCYSNYPNEFIIPVNKLIQQTNDEKVFALCAEYLIQSDTSSKMKDTLFPLLELDTYNNGWLQQPNNILSLLAKRLDKQGKISAEKILMAFLSKNYLKNNVIVYSIQRSNRDYPGITLVKDASGNFIKNNDNTIFYVQQLARSISNLPFYLTNGNTPQGIFRMDGFAVSKADFIGPTENIQLTMPFETSLKHFLKDSTITDTTWTKDWYNKLLPGELKDYAPLYESYYAGEQGRTEIIAHGTTIDQDYYRDKSYYPQTPTMGCLCTEEVWSSIDGKRVISDQQLLIDAVKKAGGANGYYIVININDAQNPVDIKEILPFIK